MKIVVAIKQVPERDAQVRIDTAGKWIEESDLQFAMNESDAYALEEALQLKEKHGGEVVVLSAGPERVGTTIREALAKGADRAIHVDSDALAQLDSLAMARLLAEAIKPESPDLVLTGLQSDDLGLGQTGVILAELLGLPHASLILTVEKTDTGLSRQTRTRERMVSDHRASLACGAHHPVGGQQAALCNPHGHQARQDQGGAARGRSGSRGAGRGSCGSRVRRSAAEAALHADPARYGEGSGRGPG